MINMASHDTNQFSILTKELCAHIFGFVGTVSVNKFEGLYDYYKICPYFHMRIYSDIPWSELDFVSFAYKVERGTGCSQMIRQIKIRNIGWTVTNPPVLSETSACHLGYALERLENISDLDFSGNYATNSDETLIVLGANKSGIKSLNLRNSRIGEGNVKHLCLEENSCLTSLDLSNSKLGGEQAKHIANGLKNHKALLTLNLSYNHIGDQGAWSIGLMLKTNKHLTNIILFNCRISVGIIGLANALSHNSSLKTLNLGLNQIDDIGATALADSLTGNSSLQILDLQRNRIEDFGFETTGGKGLADMLKHNNALTHLSLDNNAALSVECIVEMGKAIAQNTSLLYLSLNDNILSSHFEHLALGLQPNITLKTLNLENCKLSVEGIRSVAEALEVNTGLKSLALGGNDLSDCFHYLCGALKLNKSLTTLSLPRCNIKGKEVAFSLSPVLQMENKSLKKLILSKNYRISNNAFVALANTLKTNKNLNHLELVGLKIYESDSTVFGQVFELLGSLASLDMSETCGMGHLCSYSFSQGLKVSETMTYLQLSHCRIQKKGAEHLASALVTNTSLRTMHLNDNLISSEGAFHFSKALLSNHTLQVLNLAKNGIEHKGGQSLANSLLTNRALLDLDLSHNKLEDLGCQHFAECLKVNKSLKRLGIWKNFTSPLAYLHFGETRTINHVCTVYFLGDGPSYREWPRPE